MVKVNLIIVLVRLLSRMNNILALIAFFTVLGFNVIIASPKPDNDVHFHINMAGTKSKMDQNQGRKVESGDDYANTEFASCTNECFKSEVLYGSKKEIYGSKTKGLIFTQMEEEVKMYYNWLNEWVKKYRKATKNGDKEVQKEFDELSWKSNAELLNVLQEDYLEEERKEVDSFWASERIALTETCPPRLCPIDWDKEFPKTTTEAHEQVCTSVYRWTEWGPWKGCEGETRPRYRVCEDTQDCDKGKNLRNKCKPFENNLDPNNIKYFYDKDTTPDPACMKVRR